MAEVCPERIEEYECREDFLKSVIDEYLKRYPPLLHDNIIAWANEFYDENYGLYDNGGFEKAIKKYVQFMIFEERERWP
ncbi:MAG: hypothetical protein QW703_00005 [Candidatus Aenigmatarchaeota archaeon]